jgi:predicted enzyme related to lactoylglutathione lyase
MATTPARFTWYELMTNDAKAAGDFYRRVTGWTTSNPPSSAPATWASAG